MPLNDSVWLFISAKCPVCQSNNVYKDTTLYYEVAIALA